MWHKQWVFILLALVLLALLGACRQSAPQTQDLYQIELLDPLFPQAVGPTNLMVRVTDQQGNGVSDLTLMAKGDMTHAGMVPIWREGVTGEAGMYVIPWSWTMSGEWVVTITAVVDDKPVAQQRFDQTVLGGELGQCEPDA